VLNIRPQTTATSAGSGDNDDSRFSEDPDDWPAPSDGGRTLTQTGESDTLQARSANGDQAEYLNQSLSLVFMNS
jgi:hypothetical protein